MSVIDLHPEELLDKEARGTLETDERARLEAHCARCSACRFERSVRADFEGDLENEEAPAALLGLVQSALASPRSALPRQAPAPLAAERSVVAVRRRPRRTAVVLLAAAALMAASVASATGVTGRVWLRLSGAQDATHPESAAVTPTSAATPATAAAPASPRVAPVPEPTPEPAPEAIPEPVTGTATGTAAGMRAVTAAPVLPPRAAGHAASAPTPVRGGPPSPPPPPSSASTLFDAANASRRSGDTTAALAQYDALEKQFPGSPEARLVKATTGRLLLDRGDMVGALARFDAHLASPSSELREEAMAGRATALERLGRSDDEVRAWSALLAAYPRTPYAPHAQARITRSLPR